MLSPHALIAGLATFVWCILLFGVAPWMAATMVQREPAVTVAPKRFEQSVRTFARKSTSFEPTSAPERPAPKSKRSAAAATAERRNHR